MPLLWLRVATVLYGLGLVYALLLLAQKGERFGRIAVPAAVLGLVFHLVSLIETTLLYGYPELLTIRHAESDLALLLMGLFVFLYLRFRSAAAGLFIFPLAFLLTFGSALNLRPPEFSSPTMRSGWIMVHVSMLLIGYAALFLSFLSSLLYLVQARSLKSKQPSRLISRLPALQSLDELGYRSLLLGFPFMTLGLITGSIVAMTTYGRIDFSDPKILLSLLMWAVYMVMVFTRWNSGWRGRRAAFLATFAFVAAIVAWVANYFSTIHRFAAS